MTLLIFAAFFAVLGIVCILIPFHIGMTGICLLLHWRHGDTGCSNDSSKLERRARRETALTLIDPLRYGMLEQMYEGNSWNISQELEVTQQVLGDFRLAMSERVCII